jgi:hypothetical protein
MGLPPRNYKYPPFPTLFDPAARPLQDPDTPCIESEHFPKRPAEDRLPSTGSLIV